MKEATGELNMTVVTVVAITAVMGFFYVFIWPSIQTSLALNSACSAAGTGKYEITNTDGSTIECADGSCTVTDKSGAQNTKSCTNEK